MRNLLHHFEICDPFFCSYKKMPRRNDEAFYFCYLFNLNSPELLCHSL